MMETETEMRHPMDRVEWPVDVPVGPDAPVGVAVVSFNTMELTAQMIYSLFRHVRTPRFRLVVVDNASTDGSAQMLQTLADAGLCDVILNNDQRYHGPGLNQALDHLALRQKASDVGDRIGYVWVLDSDCMATRNDALSASTDLMRRTGAGIVGQRIYDRWHHGDIMGLHSLLLDPQQVWRAPITPFQEHGSPSDALQHSAAAAGVKAAEFPFTRDGYAVHLGRGTLRAIAEADDRANRYYNWARDHREPHFMEQHDAPARYSELLRRFTTDIGDNLTPASLTAVCARFSSTTSTASARARTK
jgi:glycosyltransferase involved in cell wall biosynthesis